MGAIGGNTRRGLQLHSHCMYYTPCTHCMPIIIGNCVCLGSYTDTFGIRIIREDVARYITKRDGYPADPDDVILVNGGAKGIQVH